MRVEAIYTPTIMDGPVVRFQTGMVRGHYRDILSGQQHTEWSAEITASRNGVSLSGDWPVYDSPQAIEALKGLLDEAWRAYLTIRGAREPGAAAKAIADTFNAGRATDLADAQAATAAARTLFERAALPVEIVDDNEWRVAGHTFWPSQGVFRRPDGGCGYGGAAALIAEIRAVGGEIGADRAGSDRAAAGKG